MKKIINYIKTHKVKSIIGLGVILSLLVVLVSFSLADPTPNYTFSINTDSIGGFANGYGNYNDNAHYTFNLTKKAEWIAHNKIKVTLSIDSNFASDRTKDVLLVVDTSNYLDSTELSDLKSGLLEAVDRITTFSLNNKVGVVFFNSSYSTFGFSSNETQINNYINSLTTSSGRSYYHAFKGIEDVLSNYTPTNNRDLKVIFITTGEASIHRAEGLYEYEKLKDVYPNIEIDAIYYNTNNYIITQTNNMFDTELAAMEDDVAKKIETLAFDAPAYSDFVIKDHYDTSYYSETNITNSYTNNSNHVNVGEVTKQTNGEITWKLGMDNVEESTDAFYTGMTAKLEYELDTSSLGSRNAVLNSEGIYIIYYDENFEVQSTASNSINDDIVIGNSYEVDYDLNDPAGCVPVGTEGLYEQDVYEAVQFPAEPTCTGYKFAGWKVVTSGVKKSKNGFIMPESNVEVKATWSKVSIVKSMDGDVEESSSAYNIFKYEASKTNGVVKDYDTFFASNNYSHQDAYDGSGDKKIYFFRYTNSGDDTTINNMNNVIFANHCWQMLRTTDTGGIKMIYNGEPEIGETGHEECQTTRGGHVGYNADSSDILAIAAGTVYYGSDYKYENNVFSLDTSKTITTSSDWENDYPNLIGKYTCNSTSQNGTCQTLYLIESFNSPTRANALKLKFITTATGVYSQFGEVPFNRQSTSPADVGYMYNTRYKYLSHTDLDTTSYWFGSGYSYDYNATTGQYEYTLTGTGDNPKGSTDDISETHYTCWKANKTDTCTTISYVYYHSSSGTSAKNMYYINLSDNRSVNSYLDEMLNNDNVNQYNSTIKLAIDKWYEHYILPYPEFTSKLENAVFCNDRSIKSLGGWDPGGSQTSYLQFKNYTLDNNLNCSNLTDRFSADNNNTKAHLTYPVGLMSASEMNLLNNNELRKTGTYRLISPIYFHHLNAIGCSVRSTGAVSYINVNLNYGVRPSVSLKAGVKFTSGNGSMSEPYRVD